MQVKHISIHNFRGIHEASIDLFDYNLLVGANNSGKSTVIDAIRCFYEKDGFKFKPDRDSCLLPAQDQETWVEITYDLSDDEHGSLKDDYKNTDKTLRLRKFFKSNTKDQAGTIYGYLSTGVLSADAFYGAKNVQSGKIGDIVYVPAVSKVDEHAKLSGPSALRDLLTDVLDAVVGSSASYTELASNFEQFASTIKAEQTTEGVSLASIEEELTAHLQPWGSKFELELRAPSTADIIKSLLSYQCVDIAHGKALPAEQFGSGFQRHFIYSLIQLGAKYVRKKPAKKTKDFQPSMTLILFEEPEAFLHPPQQENLAQSLVLLASIASQQVVCSTHSSHFVSRNAHNIPSIVRLKRATGDITAHQITPSAWTKIVDANQVMSAIAAKWPKLKKRLDENDLKQEMEAVKYFLWLNPDRCSMFFANHVLIVEGPTEQAFINKLIADGKITRPADGLYVLDALGKYNIHRFMNLLTHLSIPHAVLHDDDNESNEHSDINALITSSAHAQLTLAIEKVSPDTEAFLDIAKPGSDHRKPQHLLYLYETGNVPEDKLTLFIKLILKCLPNPSPTNNGNS